MDEVLMNGDRSRGSTARRALGLLLAVAAAVSVSACREARLEDAYRRLYLAKFALDFPSTPEALERCERNDVRPCLDLVEKARKGKQILQSVEPGKALNHTLKTIASTCPSQETRATEMCLGAVVALYFFNDPQQDAQILDTVIHADRSVQHKLLGPSPFAWFRNRPRPELWIKALEALPDDSFPRQGKQTVLRAFRERPPELDDGGVRLL